MNIELEKCSGTEITLTQSLFLRAIFEELTRNYNMPEGSDIIWSKPPIASEIFIIFFHIDIRL